MSTLSEQTVQASCCERIARLDPGMRPKWGRMTAHQMVCHLNDSFRVGTGEKSVSLDTNLYKRTLMKWIGLRTAMPWPRNLATRPEIEQGRGGTAPVEWERDRAELTDLVCTFANCKAFGVHPLFGEMSRSDWLVWGYRHVDHHMRQFGV